MKVSALKNQPPSSVAVKGIITQSGKKWFRVRFEEYEAWLPRSDFAGRGHRAMEKLAAREIVFIGSKAWSDFMIQVIAVNRFHKRKLIEQPGWTGCVFALPNGQVFSPSQKSRTITVFEPDHEKCIRAGTLDGWLNEVAHPLTGQNIAIFLLMLAFVPPLLKIIRRSGNFGVEIVGPKGSGKTFLLHLMSSAIGGAVEGDEPSYWVRFNTTVNAIEDLAEAHSDLPLILDDATSFAAESGPVNKGQRLFAAVFGLAQSQGKFRKGEKRPQSFRTIYAVTSNRTLADVIAAIDREEAEAAGDRLLTLNLNLCDNRNFDFIPADFADGTAFSRFLTSGMACQHGTAMPQFLQKLVDHRYADETKLREGIQLRIDELLRELRLCSGPIKLLA